MLYLKIVCPTDIIFEGDVDFVVLPGSPGQLGILPHHAPLFSALQSGQIKVKQKQSEKQFKIPSGFVEILENKATVLVSPPENQER